MQKKKRLGDRLLEAGVIDELQLRAALGQQTQWGRTIGRTLLEMRLISEEQLLPILAEHLNMPAVDLGSREINPEAAALLDEEFCRVNECIPFDYHEQGKFLDVAMSDAQSTGQFDQIRVKTRCNVRPFLAGPNAIKVAIDRAFGQSEIPVAEFAFTDAVFDFDQKTHTPAPKQDAPTVSVVSSPSSRAQPPQPEPLRESHQLVQLQRMVFALQEQCRRQEQSLRELAQQLRGLYGDLAARGLLETQAGHPLGATAGARDDASGTAPPQVPPTPFAELPPLEPLEHKDSQEIDVNVIFEGLDLTPLPPEKLARAASGRQARPAPEPEPAPEAPPVLAGAMPLVDVPAGTPTVVAMDMGTTRSSVAAVIDGQVSVLKLPGDAWDMPSVVGFRPDKTVMLGTAARKMLAHDPGNTIASPKRLLGRRFDEPQIQPYIASLGLKTQRDTRGEVLLDVHGMSVSIIEACGHILNLLRLVAEKNLGHEVHDVILTAPVSFTDRQHAALKEAAELAGLRVLEFVEEPVAATLACVTDPHCKGPVAVFDFGGGTFDFSVVDVGDGVMTVLASAGDGWLGGDDFDEALASAAANGFWRATNIELRNQLYQWQRLLVRAEHTKRALSDREQATLELPDAALTKEGGLDLVFPLTRRQFAGLCTEIIDRAFDTCSQALELSELKISDLNAVYLSGGTTYIPAVRDAVARFFGKEPRVVVPPERAVLVGAAVHGALYASEFVVDMA